MVYVHFPLSVLSKHMLSLLFNFKNVKLIKLQQFSASQSCKQIDN